MSQINVFFMGVLLSGAFFGVDLQAQEAGVLSETIDSQTLEDSNSKKVKAEKKADENIERLEVTGSYIKRIDLEGPSPLKMIEAERFSNTGVNSVEDLLRESGHFDGVLNGGSNQGHIRFHGQHAGNTLILLNGLRLPKEAGGFYTSVSYLPTVAIDRVEILKDGGAALYGSDAMAGVVNFITRKDLNGGNLSANYKVNGDGVGQEQSYTAAFGRTRAKSNFLVAAQYRKLNSFSETDVGSTTYAQGKTLQKGSFGSIKTKTTKKTLDFGLNCTAAGDCDETSNIAFTQLQPDEEDISSLAHGSVRSGDYEFQMLGIYSRKTQVTTRRPLRVRQNFETAGLQNTSLGKALKTKGAQDGERASIQGTLFDEVGAYQRERISDTANVQAQVQKDFAETWNWRMSTGYTYQQVEDQTLSGDFNSNAVGAALQAGEFQINNGNTSLRSALRNPTRRNNGSMTNAKFVAAGELMDLGEGVIAMAVGTEFEYEAFRFNNDQDVVSGEVASQRDPIDNYSGYRRVNSAFVEFTATPWRSFEAQIAGRFDSYNDVGDTINPKLGLSYRPHPTTLIRGSLATGFKPPGVRDMFTPNFLRGDGFSDPQNGMQRGFIESEVTRNEGISFETSTHYNVGVVFQPSKSLTLTLDQWNFEGRKTISNFTARHALEAEEIYGTTNGLVNNLEDLGVIVERENNDPKGDITRVVVPNVFNRAAKILRGVDLGVNYNQRVSLLGKKMNIGFENNVSHIFKRQERRFEFSELQERGNYGTHNSAGLFMSTSEHYGRLGARTLLNGDVDSYFNEYNSPTYTEFDLTYAYTPKKWGSFTVGVKNLANAQPYVDRRGNEIFYGSGSNYFSALGRRYFASYSRNF